LRSVRANMLGTVMNKHEVPRGAAAEAGYYSVVATDK